MNTIDLSVEQQVSDALGIVDGALIRGVLKVMQDEVFMTTVDGLDPVILKMGAVHARDIVYGRMARNYVAVEYCQGQERLLCPDGYFALAADRPARYASQSAALTAGERAANRRDGGTVTAVFKPYLPIA